MSTNQLEVIHYANRKCKFSESVDLKINNKTITTPTFAPRLKNESELGLYRETISRYSPNYLLAFVVRLLDVGRTLYPTLRRGKLSNLMAESIDSQITSKSEEELVLIDPALEYLYYTTNMIRLTHTAFVSHIVKDYLASFLEKTENVKSITEKKLKGNKEKTLSLDELKDALHTNFWTCMYKEPTKRMGLIRDTFNVELKCKADMLIPPVPLITSPHLFNVAVFMNERSRAFAEGKRECADYFIFKRQMLRNDHVMTSLKEYIETSESPLTIFKFKDTNLNDEDYVLERKAFKDLLMDLYLISQHSKNKSFALFEAGNQTFPTALCSFAIVSTSFSMDREDRRHKRDISPFVNWYDPTSMTLKNKETLSIMVENYGSIPCYCDVCTSNPSLLSDGFIEYNRKTKRHYLLCREQEMKEIVTAIEKQDSLMGFEKLQRSALKNLVDLIPR